MSATLNRAAFFDAVRKAPFGGKLTDSQVAGISAILDACPADLSTDKLAYCLATTFHETARTMQPIEEYGRGRGKSYGPTGFWGRGDVQLTWEANYRKATAELRKRGVLTAAEDLVKTPDLAMRPDVAAAILFYGMVEGWFTGKKLGDYFGPGVSNPVGARRIINGTDRASMIAGYHGSFVVALRTAGHAPGALAPVAAPTLTSSVAAPAVVPAPATVPAPSIWSRLHTALSRKAV